MSLEELKRLLEEAKAALAADSENAELKAKLTKAQTDYDAKLAEEESEDEPEGEAFDEEAADEKTKKYLKKLRAENAKNRLKSKDLASRLHSESERTKAILKAAGIESDDEAPEEKVKTLSAQQEQLALRNAILETAINYQIPPSGVKYFSFLINEATSELEEGEELDDEKLQEIVAEVKAGSKGTKADSSVGGGKGKAPAGDKREITLEKFTAMSMSEKGQLWATNPDLYNDLQKRARAKKILV